jgi:hypothetical protein
MIAVRLVRCPAEGRGSRGMSVCGRAYRGSVMAMCADPRSVSGVHAGCISLSSPVVSSRLAEPVFTGFAGLFATGDDWTRHWFFPDKEEVPGSSPGSPTREVPAIRRFLWLVTVDMDRGETGHRIYFGAFLRPDLSGTGGVWVEPSGIMTPVDDRTAPVMRASNASPCRRRSRRFSTWA